MEQENPEEILNSLRKEYDDRVLGDGGLDNIKDYINYFIKELFKIHEIKSSSKELKTQIDNVRSYVSTSRDKLASLSGLQSLAEEDKINEIKSYIEQSFDKLYSQIPPSSDDVFNRDNILTRPSSDDVFNRDNILKIYGLEEILNELRPKIGLTIKYLIMIYENHWRNNPNFYPVGNFICDSLEAVLKAYPPYRMLVDNKELDILQKWTATTALKEKLHQSSGFFT